MATEILEKPKRSVIINHPDVVFDEAEHTYTRKSDGYLLTGVTTILEVRAKDWLKWWPVKLMYQTLLPRLKDVQGISEQEWDEVLLDAKKAHTKKSKEAKDLGQKVHDWIEGYIKAKLGSKALPTPPDEEKIANAVNQFLAWEKEHKIQWLKSELIVASMKHLFGGTVDFLAMIDGKLTLGDFKTNSRISEEVFLQTAGYQVALEEMGVKPEQRMVVRVPKDGSEFEAKVIPTPLDFDKEVFLHLREVHRWNLLIENNYKDEKGNLKV